MIERGNQQKTRICLRYLYSVCEKKGVAHFNKTDDTTLFKRYLNYTEYVTGGEALTGFEFSGTLGIFKDILRLGIVLAHEDVNKINNATK